MNILFQFTYGDPNHNNGEHKHDYVIAKDETEAISLLGGVTGCRKVTIEKLCAAEKIVHPIPRT